MTDDERAQRRADLARTGEVILLAVALLGLVYVVGSVTGW